MKHSKLLIITFCFLLLLFTHDSKAAINVTCNPCSSAVQMHTKAVSKVKEMTEYDSVSSEYNVHVISIKNGLVKSFRVTSRPELDRRGELVTVVTGRYTATSSDLQNRVNQAHTYFNSIEASTTVPVPSSSGLGSAWSLSQNFSNHDKLDSWYKSAYPLTYWSAQLTSIFGGAVVGPLSGLELRFKFEDGSVLIMTTATAGSAVLQLNYKANSARDINGNKIPDTGSSIQGQYSFSSSAGLQRFLDKAAEYGIAVTVVYSEGWMGGSGGGSVTIVPISPE
ncbi:hypothetical protein [Pseudoalteromonas sp. MMG005]|uniref:hypothetical protein n=1 Tax=Pseudoalteromonas sp. MMG005 TaxID=2822682 RepID=UPI001B3A3ABD|nr:hypothetical protein [Pseudoalteromonas sp. MMG005]MBQ4844263.1 hypothetical protein [Pseudoalteromonas sp. MMG005]